MQLSTMVHGTGRDSRQEAHEYYRQQHQHHLYQAQRVQQHHPQDVAHGYQHHLYHQQQQQQHFKHQQPFVGAPQSPPSPPVEDLANKPSLPSISSLLGIADGERPSQEPGESNLQPPASGLSACETGREHSPQIRAKLTPPQGRSRSKHRRASSSRRCSRLNSRPRSRPTTTSNSSSSRRRSRCSISRSCRQTTDPTRLSQLSPLRS